MTQQIALAHVVNVHRQIVDVKGVKNSQQLFRKLNAHDGPDVQRTVCHFLPSAIQSTSRFKQNTPLNCRRQKSLVFSIPRLSVILTLALAIRITLAVVIQDRCDRVLKQLDLISGDAEGYWTLAERIIQGQPYSIYDPPRKVLRMPGFPALIAVPRLCGAGPLGVRIMLACVGTGCCWFVYRWGRELTDDATARLAALIAAVSPTLAGFSVMFLSETAFAAAMLISLWIGSHLLQRLSNAQSVMGTALATGIAIGMACYFRPSWLLAAPIVSVACLVVGYGKTIGRLSAWLAAVAVIFGTFIALAPWGWRNQRETGHFVLTTLWMGASLYDGWNSENSTGDSDMTFFDRENLLADNSEYEVDQIYKNRAKVWALSHPGTALSLACSKAIRYWKPWPNAEQFSLTEGILTAVSSVPVLIGIAAAWILRRRVRLVFLCAGPIIYFAGLHMIFVSSLRYRLPAEYPLFLLTAVLCRRQRPTSSAEINGG